MQPPLPQTDPLSAPPQEGVQSAAGSHSLSLVDHSTIRSSYAGSDPVIHGRKREMSQAQALLNPKTQYCREGPW